MSERDMRSLIALLEKQLGVAWSDIQDWLRSNNSLDAIEHKLATGQLSDVLADVATAAEKFAADLQHAYLDAGRETAAWLDAKVADTLVHFDTAAPQVIARARAATLEQVSGLTAESRQVIYQAIVEGHQTGANPRETARRIRDSIGLAPTQETALANYRRALESGQWSKAMGYELGDGHADRTISRLQRDGGSLTPQQVDDFAERYRRNSIAYRAETIARTESLRIAHEGHDDALTQAIQRGDVKAEQLVEEWNAGPKTRWARLDHQHMDGKTVRFGEGFTLPDGTKMRGPGDPRGGAKHNANCRCAKSTTFAAA